MDLVVAAAVAGIVVVVAAVAATTIPVTITFVKLIALPALVYEN